MAEDDDNQTATTETDTVTTDSDTGTTLSDDQAEITQDADEVQNLDQPPAGDNSQEELPPTVDAGEEETLGDGEGEQHPVEVQAPGQEHPHPPHGSVDAANRGLQTDASGHVDSTDHINNPTRSGSRA